MSHLLNGKNCFVSGATGGIGYQIALALADSDCNLFLTARNSEALASLKEEILSTNRKIDINYQAGDLKDHSDVERIIKEVSQSTGSIDVLVNCAGVFCVKSLSDCSFEDYDETFNVNVRSAFAFCHEFTNEMKLKKWGRIVNIGSSSAYNGNSNTSLYCASKHALLGFSRSLRKELAQYNIRSYFISPSGTKTEMGRHIEGQNYDTFLSPEDVATYVKFIISFDSEIVTDEVQLNRFLV